MLYFLTHVAFDCLFARVEGNGRFLIFFAEVNFIVRFFCFLSVDCPSLFDCLFDISVSRSLFSFSVHLKRLLIRSKTGTSSSSSGSSNGRFSPLFTSTEVSGDGCLSFSTLSTVLAFEFSVDTDDILDRIFVSSLSI
jgi:hypothetical protein